MNGKTGLALLLATWVTAQADKAEVSAGQKADAGAKAGQSTDAAAEAQRRELDEFKQSAARYQIAKDTERTKNLTLSQEPVLRWTNPLRATFGGAVFIWTADGRPEVVASVYRYTENGKTVQDEEFQSLATAELTATRDGQTIWAPRTAGISLAPIPGAPRPAATAAERLRQMRAWRRIPCVLQRAGGQDRTTPVAQASFPLCDQPHRLVRRCPLRVCRYHRSRGLAGD